jgi:hypothetical protein
VGSSILLRSSFPACSFLASGGGGSAGDLYAK